MPLSEEERESKLDSLIDLYGSEEWNYSLRQAPDTRMVTDQEAPLGIEDLPTRALPPKTVSSMFDVTVGIPGDALDEEDVGRAVREGAWGRLPEEVRPRAPLPQRALVQWVIQRTPENTVNVLKHFIFDAKVKTADERALVTGLARAPLWRNNPWGVKKGYQALLDSMPGYHIMYASVERKKPKEDGGSGWNPTPEEVKDAIRFINERCPTDNSQLQQLEWIISNVKNPSPIQGWPIWVVQKAADAKAKANSTMHPESFFPLCIPDVHPVFVDHILPLIVPLSTTFGVLLLGNPGVGKTPLAMILAMAIGRAQCRRRGIHKQPGWRRCKQFDGFRNKPGEVQEAIILDDADLASIGVEDIKSFGDSGESGVCDARYSPAKFAKNSLRLLLNNTWDESKEPTPMCNGKITHDDFMAMVGKTFGYIANPHLMAVFKRYITIIGGNNAVYVRPPGAEADVPVFAFVERAVAKDWLVDEHKHAYAMWKRGENVAYEGFDAAVRAEQEYIEGILSDTEEMTPPQVADWWAKRLSGSASGGEPAREASPSTPATQGLATRVRADGDGVYRFAVPQAGRGATVRARFHIAPGEAAGSTDSRPAAAAPPMVPDAAVKTEAQTQSTLARAGSPPRWVSVPPILIEDSPAPPRKRVKREPCDAPPGSSAAPALPGLPDMVMDTQEEAEISVELEAMLSQAMAASVQPTRNQRNPLDNSQATQVEEDSE